MCTYAYGRVSFNCIYMKTRSYDDGSFIVVNNYLRNQVVFQNIKNLRLLIGLEGGVCMACFKYIRVTLFLSCTICLSPTLTQLRFDVSHVEGLYFD